jgi:putative flippase GtrA
MIRFAKFVGIGGLSTLIQFLLLMLFVELSLLNKVVASATAYALSSIFNYWANYHFTFASNANHRETLPKFAAAVALGLSSNTLIYTCFLYLLDHFIWVAMDKNYLIAQFFATGITVVLNFIVHKFWIYRNH